VILISGFNGQTAVQFDIGNPPMLNRDYRIVSDEESRIHINLIFSFLHARQSANRVVSYRKSDIIIYIYIHT